MQHKNKILGIGILLVLIPLLGFPAAWRGFLSVVLGLWLCYIAISLRRVNQSSDKNTGHAEKSGVSETTTASQNL